MYQLIDSADFSDFSDQALVIPADAKTPATAAIYAAIPFRSV